MVRAERCARQCADPETNVRNVETSERPDEPGTVASVPFMITRQMKADLKARGFSDAQIRKMTPGQAHRHLAGEAPRAPERCAHCGGELKRGDMLPLNNGGHVHHRCADDFMRAGLKPHLMLTPGGRAGRRDLTAPWHRDLFLLGPNGSGHRKLQTRAVACPK